MKSDVTPCGARTRKGTPCRQPVVPGRSRCHYHGGASLRGRDHPRYRHGGRTQEAIAQRREAAALSRMIRDLLGQF